MMKCYILLLAVAIAAPITDAGRYKNIIVRGKIAKDGQFPYAISLRHFRNHMCGGSILNEEWILTAGHCVSGYQAWNMSIVAGSNYLSDGGISHNVSFMVLHENYFSKKDDQSFYDIALAKLSTPLVFTPKIQPISLVTSLVPVDSQLVLSGWGLTRVDSDVSEKLRYLEVASIDLEECRHRFVELKKYELNETMLCAVQENGSGACNGDSGSALVYKGSVAGVASWVEPCGIGYPDAYTNVQLFVDWIQEQINKY